MISPIQKSLLTIAAQCLDRAIRWPTTLWGGARNRIIAALTGAGLAEKEAAFGWQPHKVRGAIAGAIKKEARPRRYIRKG